MPENKDAEQNGGEGQQEQGKTFTQADVDRIVKDRLEQQARNKFPNYDEYKAKAEGAKSVEDKLSELDTKYREAEARALRSDIAAKYGISAEDRDLFLTGSDEAALDAQAKRLADRVVDQKKNGNRAPKEGDTKNKGPGDGDKREFARALFGRPD